MQLTTGDMLSGGGATGAVLRAFPWSDTPLGPIEVWPQSLRTAVRILLNAGSPMLLWWGQELITLYNDAAIPLLGTRHPRALGKPAADMWAEAWPTVQPSIELVLKTGQASVSGVIPLLREHDSLPAETYVTCSFSPLPDDAGGVGGVLGICSDATRSVLSERRSNVLRNLAARTGAGAKTVEEACRAAAAVLNDHPHDLPFALIYLLDQDGRQARLCEAVNLPAATQASPLTFTSGGSADPWDFQHVLDTGTGQIINDLEPAFGGLPASPWSDDWPRQTLVLPLAQGGAQNLPVGLLVAGLSPHLPFADDYRAFLELLAGQLGSAMAAARAAELQARTRTLEQLLNQLDEHYVAYDRDWRYAFVNTRGAEVLGLPIEQLLGQSIWELFPDAVGNEYYQAVHRALAEQQSFTFEFYYPPFKRWFENRIFAAPEGVSVFASDITQRKLAEERLQHLHVLSAHLVEVQTLSEVRQLLLHEVVQALGADNGGLRRVTDGELVLDDYKRGAHTTEEAVRRAAAVPLGSQHPAAEVVRTGTPVFVGNAEELRERYPHLAEAVAQQHIEAIAHLPLTRGEEIFGVLSLAFAEPRAWDEAGRRFALALADRAAVAYERARLFEAEREAMQALRTSELRTRLAMQIARIGTWQYDLVTQRVELDERLRAIWGEPQDTTGLPLAAVMERIHPDDRALVASAIAASLEAGSPGSYEIEYRIVWPDGSEHWVAANGQVHTNEAAEPQPVAFLGTARDITERKQAEEALRTSEARLVAFMEHSPGAMFMKDAAGRYTLANQAFLATLGRTVEQVIGQTDHELFPAELAEVFVAEDREVRTSSVARRFEDTLSLNGRRATYLSHKFPLPDGSVGCVTADITDQKQSEERLQQLNLQEQAARAQAEEASQLKDEFLATVSHELRTPLTAFLGYTQMLQRRLHDQAYVARTVEKLLRSAKDQAQLIEDLLDISRIVSGKLRIEAQPIDLVAVIRAALDTVHLAVEAKGLQLHVDLSPEAGTVIGDANRLQQVVWNLLTNATKFTPTGGHIFVRLEQAGREARLTVSDTGRGISPAFLPYVFDRFRQADATSQRAHGGLGLGLSIVRHLVELHGGTVAAASAGVNQGATFTVQLPLDIGSGAEITYAADDEQAVLQDCPPKLVGLRVLVVEDQPDILGLIDEILASCGMVVRTCTTAREGLEIVRAWQPDLLVSDIAMPGDDGYWLIRHVRALPDQEGSAIPAIALTAYVRLEDRLQVLAAGFHRYVPKPVEAVELLDVVAQLVHPEAAG